MTFNWSTLLTLGILCASVHWIVARAKITEWFWDADWLPKFLNNLLTCPACSGFWLGLLFGIAGLRPLVSSHTTLDVLTTSVAGLFCTPLVEAVFLWGLDRSKIN